jgi:hypothetical protein
MGLAPSDWTESFHFLRADALLLPGLDQLRVIGPRWLRTDARKQVRNLDTPSRQAKVKVAADR